MIVIALDALGNTITADKAQHGVLYFCPICGCEMYVTFRLGNPHFACMPGHNHTNYNCQHNDKNHTIRLTQMTNQDKFHHYLMTVPFAGSRGGNGSGHITRGNGTPPKIVDPFIRTLPYKSLADIYQNGLLSINHDVPIADGLLTDLCISSKLAHNIMHNNVALGPKALQVKIDGHFTARNAIRFVSCDFEGHKRKVFDVIFPDNAIFQQWVNKLFVNYLDNNGLTQTKARYKFILVHGNWESMPTDACNTLCSKNCKGKWSCTGYQYSYYIGSRQIYCPPDQLER